MRAERRWCRLNPKPGERPVVRCRALLRWCLKWWHALTDMLRLVLKADRFSDLRPDVIQPPGIRRCRHGLFLECRLGDQGWSLRRRHRQWLLMFVGFSLLPPLFSQLSPLLSDLRILGGSSHP